MQYLTPFLTSGVVRGILTGFAAAIVIDIQAFRKFKNLDEFAAYDWRTAAFRGAQGAVVGLLGSTVSILD